MGFFGECGAEGCKQVHTEPVLEFNQYLEDSKMLQLIQATNENFQCYFFKTMINQNKTMDTFKGYFLKCDSKGIKKKNFVT